MAKKQTKEVEFTGAVDKAGVPISAVGWSTDDNTATLGGEAVKATKTPNDKAYTKTEDATEAIDAYKESTGIKSGSELNQEYHKYDDDKNKLQDDIVYRKAWSYDPNKDPAYLAYKVQYQNIARQTLENTLAQFMARTGGMMNSAAQTAASAGYNAQMAELNSKIPELEKQSFERYQAQDQMDKEALDKVEARSKNDYDTAKASSEMAVDVADKNYDRQQARVTDALGNKQKRIDADYYEEEKKADLEKTKADTEKVEADKSKTEAQTETEKAKTETEKAETEKTKAEANETDVDYQNALYNYYIQRGKNRGYFTKEEAEYLGVSTSMSPFDMENNYFEQVTKPQLEAEQQIKGYNTYKSRYGY